MEDSPILRDFVIEAISENESTSVVGCAETESEAIDGVVKLRPEVVILDIKLRQGNGLNVLRKIRQMLSSNPPVVIVLTNYRFETYQKRCMELGADYFVDKSTQFDQVKRILEQMVRGNLATLNRS